MPSARRIRLLCVALLAGVVITMLWTSHTNQQPVQPLADTAAAPPPRTGPDKEGGAGDAAAARGMTDRLKQAEQKAKDLANSKAPLKPDSPSEVVGVGSSADGQDGEDEVVESKGETDEEHVAEQELRLILKKAPVIIFSKTFCPHSKKAKKILLDKYSIDPPPHVVELDVHPQGSELQSLLGEKTGRRTVPNVMVNGVSIGGGDEVAALDTSGELEAKVEDLGEARSVEVKVRAGGG